MSSHQKLYNVLDFKKKELLKRYNLLMSKLNKQNKNDKYKIY